MVECQRGRYQARILIKQAESCSATEDLVSRKGFPPSALQRLPVSFVLDGSGRETSDSRRLAPFRDGTTLSSFGVVSEKKGAVTEEQSHRVISVATSRVSVTR